MRLCPFEGCGKSIPSDKFACPKHWFSLCADHKSRVWEAYNAWKSGAIDGTELQRLQDGILAEAQRPKPAAASGANCRSCKAPVIWARTMGTGSLMPLENQPHDFGTIRLEDDGVSCTVLAQLEAAAEREKGRKLYRSHFASCPNAGDHRKRRKS